MDATLENARDAFLNLIADAVEWKVDEDADCEEGVWRDHTTFTIVTKRMQLEELAEALGIKRRYDECVSDAIDRAIEEEPQAVSDHQSAVDTCGNG